nr:14483_t:CDS:2 [Entrophospora candida]
MKKKLEGIKENQSDQDGGEDNDEDKLNEHSLWKLIDNPAKIIKQPTFLSLLIMTSSHDILDKSIKKFDMAQRNNIEELGFFNKVE